MQLIDVNNANIQDIDCDWGCTTDLWRVEDWLKSQPIIDAVPVDVVAQMFFDFTGDLCPCNFNDTDEWLPEVCEQLNECPRPKEDNLACWKQYIKHWQPRKDVEDG